MSYTTPHLDKYISDEALAALVQHVKEQRSADVVQMDVVNREVVLTVRRAEIAAVLAFLRDDPHCQFKILIDLCGVDWLNRPGREQERFDVVYHLLSMTKNLRLRVKVHVPDGESVPSVTEVFSNANWYERECYDLFGISFEDHPDMRRILTDYDFDGHPLRKDFPVTGKVEVYYDEAEERVAYKPIDMPQAFRRFDSTSPWAAATGNAVLAEEDSVFDEEEFKRG